MRKDVGDGAAFKDLRPSNTFAADKIKIFSPDAVRFGSVSNCISIFCAYILNFEGCHRYAEGLRRLEEGRQPPHII